MNQRLERIADEAVVGGVAAGLAHYFGINRTVVRLLFLIGIPLPGFPSLLIYGILWIVMPQQPQGMSVHSSTLYANPLFSMNPYNPNQPNTQNRSLIGGAILIVLGVLFLIDRYFDIDLGDLFPFILIALGLWFIFRDRIRPPYDNNSNPPSSGL
ncbi:PspC domain-containing protein [Spirosoma rhododendri]|uniref:PspC domain-containing protein n=1 Tax=Spirosoma rhododendri TaxID=2728024 RepID=A0A7L5DR82_9BACT|nr:PspC domain-containing protein [Spirosoma rhododendri]QJD79961.1 PspC domain-containing protein [Spirosoma rhododendri]